LATAGENNREIFDILNSHNMLSARRLQKNPETSIYNGAEMGKADWIAKRLNMGAAVVLANQPRDAGTNRICGYAGLTPLRKWTKPWYDPFDPLTKNHPLHNVIR
jgi:hypothetical protein